MALPPWFGSISPKSTLHTLISATWIPLQVMFWCSKNPKRPQRQQINLGSLLLTHWDSYRLNICLGRHSSWLYKGLNWCWFRFCCLLDSIFFRWDWWIDHCMMGQMLILFLWDLFEPGRYLGGRTRNCNFHDYMLQVFVVVTWVSVWNSWCKLLVRRLEDIQPCRMLIKLLL